MIEIKNVWVGGFEGALRGMRNPYESHGKSDSSWDSHCALNADYQDCENCSWKNLNCELAYYRIGKADMELAKKLINAGSEHRKFLRMIHVQADVIAPRYWWAEMDKYKYVEANSSSTMHLITKRFLTDDDFSTDGSVHDVRYDGLNILIQLYMQAEDKEVKDLYFRSIKQNLPESFNQLRTIDTNYEALLSIHHQRYNHRLTEWREFCGWIEGLPYMKEFLGTENR